MANRWNVPAPTAHKRHNWCGPYALAVLLRTSYDAAYTRALNITRRKTIKGMWNSEVVKVAASMGLTLRKRPMEERYQMEDLPAYEADLGRGSTLRVRPRKNYGRPKTLSQWYKDRPDKQATYLVNITGHYVVIRGTRIIDNQSKQWETFSTSKKHKRARVREVFMVT